MTTTPRKYFLEQQTQRLMTMNEKLSTYLICELVQECVKSVEEYINKFTYLVGTGSTVAVVDFDSRMSFRIRSFERERENERARQWKEHWK